MGHSASILDIVERGDCDIAALKRELTKQLLKNAKQEQIGYTGVSESAINANGLLAWFMRATLTRNHALLL